MALLLTLAILSVLLVMTLFLVPKNLQFKRISTIVARRLGHTKKKRIKHLDKLKDEMYREWINSNQALLRKELIVERLFTEKMNLLSESQKVIRLSDRRNRQKGRGLQLVPQQNLKESTLTEEIAFLSRHISLIERIRERRIRSIQQAFYTMESFIEDDFYIEKMNFLAMEYKTYVEQNRTEEQLVIL
jgi:uncharacterized HAD superfamily protein